jgi:hypothetical protein
MCVYVCMLCVCAWNVRKLKNSSDLRELFQPADAERQRKWNRNRFCLSSTSRAKTADSSNATKLLNKNRVSLWHISEDFSLSHWNVIESRRNENSTSSSSRVVLEPRVKFISFSSIFLEVGNIYPQDYSASPSISLSVWLETYPAEKRYWKIWRGFFSHFCLVLVIWRDRRGIDGIKLRNGRRHPWRTSGQVADLD